MEPSPASSKGSCALFLDSSDDPRQELENCKVVDNHTQENGLVKKNPSRFGEVLAPPPSHPDAKLIDERLKMDFLEPEVVQRQPKARARENAPLGRENCNTYEIFSSAHLTGKALDFPKKNCSPLAPPKLSKISRTTLMSCGLEPTKRPTSSA
jgi:hypothetical protein